MTGTCRLLARTRLGCQGTDQDPVPDRRARGFATVPPGKVTLAGIAWAQPAGIDRVEVRVNDGAWQQARLATEVNTRTWRMWRLETDLGPGAYKAEVRATDRAGRTQTRERVPPIPDGATGWHATDFTVG